MTALCSNYRITSFEIGLQMYVSNTPPKAQAIAMKRSGGVIFLSCMKSSLSVLAQRTDQTSNELQHLVSAPGLPALKSVSKCMFPIYHQNHKQLQWRGLEVLFFCAVTYQSNQAVL